MSDQLQHVLLDYSEHFLVVNGTRGPVVRSHDSPAHHPSGYFRYRDDIYQLPKELAGKVFRVADVECAQEKVDTCEPAQTAFKQYIEIQQSCSEIVTARYVEAAKSDEAEQAELRG